MAEDSSSPRVTPAEKDFGGTKTGRSSAQTPGSLNRGRIPRRSSTGSFHNLDNAQRYSREKPDSTNTSHLVSPRYLRPTIASCHDMCKYGRRYAFEEKAAVKPLRKTISQPSLKELTSKEKVVKHKPSSDAEKRSHLVMPSPDAKSFFPKLKASVDAKTHSPSRKTPSSGKTRLQNSPTKKSTSSVPPEIIKRKISSPKKVEVLVKEGSSVEKKMSRISVKDSSSVTVKAKSSTSGNSDGNVRTGRKLRASTVSANKAFVPVAAPKLSRGKTASNETRMYVRAKSVSPPKDQIRIDGVDTETFNGKVLEKILHVIENGTENNSLGSSTNNYAIPAVASLSSPLPSPCANPSPLFHEDDDEEIRNGNETDEYASGNMASMEICKVKPVKENHKPLKKGEGRNVSESIPDGLAFLALTSQSSPKSLSRAKPPSLSCRGEHDEEIKYGGNDANFVTENIISIRDGHASPSPLKSLSHRKSPSLSSHEEDDEEIEHIGYEADKSVPGNRVTAEISKAKSPKENNKKNVRKNQVVSSGEKHCRHVKLKFRSGKVVDLHQDNNNPRRLRFRRTRGSGNDSKKADDSVSDMKKSVETHPVKKNNKILKKSKVAVSGDKSRSPARLFRSEKIVSVQQGNKTRSPVRLFRSEKIAEVQPGSKTPWRLVFRRARIIGVEDSKGGVKRTIKKTGGEDDAAGAELSSRKVNLKHRDLQAKKDAQRLYNNVIEETASKLVETRKSKVKALVGAFETVISLQERKPSSCIAS